MTTNTVSVKPRALFFCGTSLLISGIVIGIIGTSLAQRFEAPQQPLRSLSLPTIQSRVALESDSSEDTLGDAVLAVQLDSYDPKQAILEAAALLPGDAKGKKYGVMINVWPFVK